MGKQDRPVARSVSLASFESLARSRPNVWAVYQHWKASPSEAERIARAHDLTSALERADVELARAWLDVLAELGWLAPVAEPVSPPASKGKDEAPDETR
jgi:hypothetical protein